MKELIGLKDREGTEIKEGDIVEFFVAFSFDVPPTPEYSNQLSKGDDPDYYTRMLDVVEKIDGEWVFTLNEINSSTHASRHNEHCIIRGNIHDDSGLYERLKAEE